MFNEITIRAAQLEDIPAIEMLAHRIWPLTYGDILTGEQLQYMLRLIYHPDSLRKQIIEQHHRFLMAECGEEPVGFASFSPTTVPGRYKLHKLYVSTALQGKGLGRALLQEIISIIKKENATALQLNVNRHNKAKTFYEKLDFKVIQEEKIDIGNGYYMDDYVMERPL